MEDKNKPENDVPDTNLKTEAKTNQTDQKQSESPKKYFT